MCMFPTTQDSPMSCISKGECLPSSISVLFCEVFYTGIISPKALLPLFEVNGCFTALLLSISHSTLHLSLPSCVPGKQETDYGDRRTVVTKEWMMMRTSTALTCFWHPKDDCLLFFYPISVCLTIHLMICVIQYRWVNKL